MPIEFRVPGTLGPQLEVRRSRLGAPQLYANGERLKGRRFRGPYEVRTSDGRLHELRFNAGITALKVRIDGSWLQLEAPLARWEVGLTLLPLGVMGYLGGVLGVLYGALGVAANRRIARSDHTAAARATAMIGATAMVAGLYLATVVAFLIAVEVVNAPAVALAVGSCYVRVEEGDTIAPGDLELVDCGRPHDYEVVASVTHPDAWYPGDQALSAFGEDACLVAFEAYVGLPYLESQFYLQWSQPQMLTWATGDHQVDCLLVGAEGERLSGSARGSRR